MTLARNTFLAATLVAVAGLAALAASHTHVTTVHLPDGSTETIASLGSPPPRISLVPRSVLVPLDDPFAPDPVFADLARTAQAMARDEPGGLSLATALAGQGVCVRSVEYHYSGDGRPPRVVRHVSGQCAGARDPGPAIGPVFRSAPRPALQSAEQPAAHRIVA